MVLLSLPTPGDLPLLHALFPNVHRSQVEANSPSPYFSPDEFPLRGDKLPARPLLSPQYARSIEKSHNALNYPIFISGLPTYHGWH